MKRTLTSFVLVTTLLLIQSIQLAASMKESHTKRYPMLKLGSLTRIFTASFTSEDNNSTLNSPKTPKTPHSKSSSASSSPDQSPQTPRMSPRPQQLNDRTLSRQVKKEKRKKEQYEQLIYDMRTCIFNGDANNLDKLAKNVKTLTPRLFQYIAEATGVPNLQHLLHIILASNKGESGENMQKKYFERYGTTPLHEAASFNNTQALLSFGCMLGILEADSPINDLTDSQQRPPLFDAASVKIAQQLIEWGANVNAQDNKGNTFLHYCCADGSSEFIETLLKNGADINQKNSDEQTPFLYRLPQNRDAFTLMIGNSRIQLMDCDKRGHNALHRLILSRASAEDKVYFARILKKMGVDMHKSDNDNNLPHHIWASYGIMPGAQDLITFAVEECNINMLLPNKAFQNALNLISCIPTCHSKNGPLGEPIKRQIITATALKIESNRVASLTKYIENITALQWAKNEANAKANINKPQTPLNNDQEQDDSSSKILRMMTLNASDIESI